MPSHPDRVRRNYHDITIQEYPTYYMETQIIINISRLEIATCMSRIEIERKIFKLVRKGLDSNRMIPD